MDENTVIIPMNKKILMKMREVDQKTLINLSDSAKENAGRMKLIIVDKAGDCEIDLKIGDEVICSNISALGKFKHGDPAEAFYMIDEKNVNAVIR